MILELDIFFLTTEQISLEENGIDVPFKDMNLKQVTFYDISYITPRTDEPQYTIIGSGGMELTCNEKIEDVKKKIHEARIFKFN